jgi:hypothetical protein
MEQISSSLHIICESALDDKRRLQASGPRAARILCLGLPRAVQTAPVDILCSRLWEPLRSPFSATGDAPHDKRFSCDQLKPEACQLLRADM